MQDSLYTADRALSRARRLYDDNALWVARMIDEGALTPEEAEAALREAREAAGLVVDESPTPPADPPAPEPEPQTAAEDEEIAEVEDDTPLAELVEPAPGDVFVVELYCTKRGDWVLGVRSYRNAAMVPQCWTRPDWAQIGLAEYRREMPHVEARLGIREERELAASVYYKDWQAQIAHMYVPTPRAAAAMAGGAR